MLFFHYPDSIKLQLFCCSFSKSNCILISVSSWTKKLGETKYSKSDNQVHVEICICHFFFSLRVDPIIVNIVLTHKHIKCYYELKAKAFYSQTDHTPKRVTIQEHLNQYLLFH